MSPVAHVPVGSHDPTNGTVSQPSPWLCRWLAHMPCQGHALDFACGQGRNSLALLQAGMAVTALDRDQNALDHLVRRAHDVNRDQAAKLTTIAIDLELQPWTPHNWVGDGGFDVIVVSNYLHRSRLALLAHLLKPGGWWIYETFMQGHERYGRPTRDAFLLAPGELLRHAQMAGLEVVAFEQGLREPPSSASQAVVQRIVAQRPPTVWPCIS